MSKAVDYDFKVANMPQIRLIKKPMRDRNNLRSLPVKNARDEFIPSHKPSRKQSPAIESGLSRNSYDPNYHRMGSHSTKNANLVKRQLNYDLISARIQKQLNGDLKIDQKQKFFQGQDPSSQYDMSTLELRKQYKNMCVKNRHSL